MTEAIQPLRQAVRVTLPDGSTREFPGPVTVAEVAQSIGAGLAKAALGARWMAGSWTRAAP